jgi:hypothetical protein
MSGPAHVHRTAVRYALGMKKHVFAILTASLLASGCGHSSGAASQSASNASSAPAGAPASSSLQGVKYRVPLYPNNITRSAELGIAPGIYQYQTSDAVLTVVAWYKSHVPSAMGGTWVSSDPSSPADITDWSYTHAQTPGGEFSVDVEHARKGVPVYAAGTKTIVEVVDR